jgi:hypothetical protein
LSARRWYRPDDVTEARVRDEGVPLPPDTDRVPYAETVPTLAGTADRLRPYLRRIVDLGCPGMSERDRNDFVNLAADLETAASRVVR